MNLTSFEEWHCVICGNKFLRRSKDAGHGHHIPSNVRKRGTKTCSHKCANIYTRRL